MNKKIILGLTVVALLATSAVASCQNKHMNQENDSYKSCNMKKHNKHKGSHPFIGMVMKLDLTDEQRSQIVSIVKDAKQDAPNPSQAFSDKSFDKKEFIKLANERRQSKIERKADMIEKVYKVLTSSQKKDLKTMLDMKDVMKKNMINKGKNCDAKNCNGGK